MAQELLQIRQLLDLETPGILSQCDQVIGAGQGFDNFYTSAYKGTIETAEGEGIAALASEVGRIELGPSGTSACSRRPSRSSCSCRGRAPASERAR